MYLRKMGSVSLLTREGEVEIAKRIEDGEKEVLDAMAEMERAGDQTDAKRLDSLLKKHAQTVALERKQRPSPRVPRT